MSMGFLVPQDSPVAWRGLMVQKAMNQLLFEVAWPKLDLLVLDLPPGTGDVQLTITQSIDLAGMTCLAAHARNVRLLMAHRCCNRIHPTRYCAEGRCERSRPLQESQRTNLRHDSEYEYVCLCSMRARARYIWIGWRVDYLSDRLHEARLTSQRRKT